MKAVRWRGVGARLRAAYEVVYGMLCGRLPGPVRPWHHKWLAIVDLQRDLNDCLPDLRGTVLDVGCGRQPYRRWLSGATGYVGVDVEPQPGVDRLITPGVPWPLADASFDAVLCTQVLEHDSAPHHTLSEISRVLRPGGIVIVTVPFAYNEHALPHDYRRWSAAGAASLVSERFHVAEIRKQGRVGTLLGALLLNWMDQTTGRRPMLQVVRALGLPVWIACCAVVNALARIFDALDRTGAFYLNVMVVAKSPGA